MAASGTTTVNFGSFPGATDASVAVTGQTGILAGSIVGAWITPVATADHSADEHLVEQIRVYAGNIVAGTGFTIWLEEDVEATPDVIQGAVPPLNRGGNEGHRLYGSWTVAWAWA